MLINGCTLVRMLLAHSQKSTFLHAEEFHNLRRNSLPPLLFEKPFDHLKHPLLCTTIALHNS